MNTLTVNLHLLMVSFTGLQKRDTKSFVRRKHSSDQYMFQSQVNFHGYKADDALVEIKRRDGEHIRTEDVLAKLMKLETNWLWF
jgi:kynureninase